MEKVKISFPQIVIEIKEIEVSKYDFDDLTQHASDAEKANFIWNNMSEQEQQWTQGKEWIENAIDAGYSNIKKVI